MDSRVSHALVAVAAVVLTAGVYEVRDALRETAAAVDRVLPGATAAKSERIAKTDKPWVEEVVSDMGGEEAGVDRTERKEARTERLVGRADELGVSLGELREFRLEKKAEEKGVASDELRERRRAAPDALANRRGARAEWRSTQDPEVLEQRKESRLERRDEWSDEQIEAREELRDYRKQAVEEYPSVGDAAKVLQQLRVMGAGENSE